MLSTLKKIMNKRKEKFGDTKWEYSPEQDKKSFVLEWFRQLPRNSKILEAGCGTGNYVVSLCKIRHDVIGVEIDSERVEIARKYMKKYKLNPKKIIRGDITNLPFKDCEFDAIFCHGVIEHVPDSEKAVKEMTRVLKKNGFAMISVPNRYTFFTVSKVILQSVDKIMGTRLWNVGYEKSFSQGEFKRIISKHLKIVKFIKREVQPGTTFPFYGKILRAIDKPFWIAGVGGGWLYSWSKK